MSSECLQGEDLEAWQATGREPKIQAKKITSLETATQALNRDLLAKSKTATKQTLPTSPSQKKKKKKERDHGNLFTFYL